MSASNLAPVAHINLFNPGLLPTKKSFSARSVTVWATVAVLAMIGVGWWAVIEKEKIARQVQEQAARVSADSARSAEAMATPQQLAALEQAVRAKQTVLESKRALRDGLRYGAASEASGPSATLRLMAATIPAEVWLTQISARGSRLEIAGRTINPMALAGWMNRLGETGFFAARPVSSVKLESADFAGTTADAAQPVRTNTRLGVYTFALSADLARPLADDGVRQP